ncbi:hypothetical protein [Paenibacillus sp. GXUN7292]
MSKQQAAMNAALEALIKKLERESIAAERVVAVSTAIEALSGIRSLSQL